MLKLYKFDSHTQTNNFLKKVSKLEVEVLWTSIQPVADVVYDGVASQRLFYFVMLKFSNPEHFKQFEKTKQWKINKKIKNKQDE
jgi:hypothetical protein